jgi:hypothetical protein
MKVARKRSAMVLARSGVSARSFAAGSVFRHLQHESRIMKEGLKLLPVTLQHLYGTMVQHKQLHAETQRERRWAWTAMADVVRAVPWAPIIAVVPGGIFAFIAANARFKQLLPSTFISARGRMQREDVQTTVAAAMRELGVATSTGAHPKGFTARSLSPEQVLQVAELFVSSTAPLEAGSSGPGPVDRMSLFEILRTPASQSRVAVPSDELRSALHRMRHSSRREDAPALREQVRRAIERYVARIATDDFYLSAEAFKQSGVFSKQASSAAATPPAPAAAARAGDMQAGRPAPFTATASELQAVCRQRLLIDGDADPQSCTRKLLAYLDVINFHGVRTEELMLMLALQRLR